MRLMRKLQRTAKEWHDLEISPVRMIQRRAKGKYMRTNRQWIWLWAVAMMAIASSSHAQSVVTPEDEYKKLIKVDQVIQPLGAHPFGETMRLGARRWCDDGRIRA